MTPKIDCFIEYLNELESSLAFLTETWLPDSTELTNDIKDLETGTGYGLLCKNRLPNSRGYSTVGVALAFKKSQIEFTELSFPGNEYEILFASGTMPMFTRKFIAICVYLPPSMSTAMAMLAMLFLVDALLEIKCQFKDPFIALSGDFNNHDIEKYLEDYPDLVLLLTGPTRGGSTLDKIFTNFSDNIFVLGTITPLEWDDPSTGRPSDHRVVHCSAKLERYEAYEWMNYSYTKQTQTNESVC